MVKNDTKATPTDVSGDAVEEISSNLRRMLAERRSGIYLRRLHDTR
jgi:hypothetical protein